MLMDMEPNELRQMVLSVAATMAHKVIDVVEKGGLSSGFMEESVEVAGVTWDVSTVYYGESQVVRVSGSPRRDAEHPPHPFMLIFSAGQTEDDGSFAFSVPASWLPEQVVETREQETLKEVI
jgi:hypothetical protein